jgi:hypothetical protein
MADVISLTANHVNMDQRGYSARLNGIPGRAATRCIQGITGDERGENDLA